jgi:hypothetical protein
MKHNRKQELSTALIQEHFTLAPSESLQLITN